MSHEDKTDTMLITRWWSSGSYRWTVTTRGESVTLDVQEMADLIRLMKDHPTVKLLLEAALTGQGG